MLHKVEGMRISRCSKRKDVAPNTVRFYENFHLTAHPQKRLSLIAAICPLIYNKNRGGGIIHLNELDNFSDGPIAEILARIKPRLVEDSSCAIMICGGKNHSPAALANRERLGALAIAQFAAIGIPESRITADVLAPGSPPILDFDLGVGFGNIHLPGQIEPPVRQSALPLAA